MSDDTENRSLILPFAEHAHPNGEQAFHYTFRLGSVEVLIRFDR